MSDDFYVECHLRGSTGDVKLAEIACRQSTAAYGVLVNNLERVYQAEDGSRIQLRLRKASPLDVAAVTDLLHASNNPSLQAAWADAAVTLATGTQNTQFNSEYCAPEEWVSSVESIQIGDARWRDASWGNNAAPSWELVVDNRIVAEAFYYTSRNAERHTDHFAAVPFVQVALFDSDEVATRGFELSPDNFLELLAEAAARDTSAMMALTQSAQRQSTLGHAFWVDLA